MNIAAYRCKLCGKIFGIEPKFDSKIFDHLSIVVDRRCESDPERGILSQYTFHHCTDDSVGLAEIIGISPEENFIFEEESENDQDPKEGE